MNRPSSVAVVVARTGPTPVLDRCLARFADEVGPLGEVVLVDGSGQVLRDLGPRIRVIRRPQGRLAPELWRDGLLVTKTSLVAFSTAQMIPSRGWLASMVRRLESTEAAGVGGPIEPARSLSRVDRAVALLRYLSYFPPLSDSSKPEPPGDNALYRRDRLIEVEASWLDGFWEVEVHRALRGRGETLAIDESAVVAFEGGVGLLSMIRQRWRHAQRYGTSRSLGLGLMARLARSAAFPVVPFVLFGRIVKALKSRGMGLSPWLPSMPALMVLAWAWAMGEALGTWLPGASSGRQSGSRLPHAQGSSLGDFLECGGLPPLSGAEACSGGLGFQDGQSTHIDLPGNSPRNPSQERVR